MVVIGLPDFFSSAFPSLGNGIPDENQFDRSLPILNLLVESLVPLQLSPSSGSRIHRRMELQMMIGIGPGEVAQWEDPQDTYQVEEFGFHVKRV